jgi:hypothetical protein
MTTANLLPVSTYCSARTTDCVWTSVSLDSFNLNMRYIDIGDIAGSMLRNTLYQGQYFIKSSTYIGSNATIANGSFGNVSVPLQIRNSSVKSLFWYYALSTSVRCPNGFYDAIIPNSISTQVNISGKKYPQKPLNPTAEPADCYIAYKQAWGSSSLKGIEGIINRSCYGAVMGAVSGRDPQVVVPANAVRNSSIFDASQNVIVDFGNMHYEGIDLERISGSLFSGVNTRQAPPFIELNIGLALDANVSLYGFALCDCIIKIDPATKSCEVLI